MKEKPILTTQPHFTHIQCDVEQKKVVLHGLYLTYGTLENLPNAFKVEITTTVAEEILRAKFFVENTQMAVYINRSLEAEHFHYDDTSDALYFTDDSLDYPLTQIESIDIIVTSGGIRIHARVKQEDIYLESRLIPFELLDVLKLLAPKVWTDKIMSLNWHYADIEAAIMHDYTFDEEGKVLPNEYNCTIVDEYLKAEINDFSQGFDVDDIREAIAICYPKLEKAVK